MNYTTVMHSAIYKDALLLQGTDILSLKNPALEKTVPSDVDDINAGMDPCYSCMQSELYSLSLKPFLSSGQEILWGSTFPAQ